MEVKTKDISSKEYPDYTLPKCGKVEVTDKKVKIDAKDYNG